MSVKHKQLNSYISLDLIVNNEDILLLKYEESIFKLVHKLQIGQLTEVIPNKKKRSLKIYDKCEFKDKCLEIYTESYASLMVLIDDIINARKVKYLKI